MYVAICDLILWPLLPEYSMAENSHKSKLNVRQFSRDEYLEVD